MALIIAGLSPIFKSLDVFMRFFKYYRPDRRINSGWDKIMINRTLTLLAALPILASVCVTFAFNNETAALVQNVPHVKQKEDFCGEACVEMVLRKLCHTITQDDVFNLSGVNPMLARGCYTAELAGTMRKLGFETGPVWFNVKNLPDKILTCWTNLYSDLAMGIPSIVCMHYDDQPATTEHFRLITGYDPASDEVIYNEPAIEKGGYLRMKKDLFLKLWPLKNRYGENMIVRLRCQPKTITPPAICDNISPSDYAQHMIALKKKLADFDFAFVLEPPFIIIGDEDLATVNQRAEQTVKWAVEKLKADYFKKDPMEIIDIYLFRNKSSYEKNTIRLFNEKPTTPYGFYSEENHALIMNIATGGGTLVHEIVHPYMRANFPTCPAWLNEGMGSLYEQSAERNGHIVGLTNWRLAGLKEEITNGTLPPFYEMLMTTTRQFYSSNRGNNYAQARYLCYYLQENKLLVKFFHEFIKNHEKDPSGLKTLKTVLGENDMDVFQKKWERFVMGLTFP